MQTLQSSNSRGNLVKHWNLGLHCSIARAVNVRVRSLQLSCLAPCMGRLPWLASPGAAATSGAKRISFLFLGLVACCTVCCSSLACAAAPSCAKRISLLVLGVVACCTVRCNGCGCLHGACGAMHAAYALRFPAPVGQRRRLLAI